MPIVGRCPACGGTLAVRRLQCADCETAVEGLFSLSRFDLLLPGQVSFLETFLRARGNIREVERLMGLSYPAVRARLDQVLRVLKLDSDEVDARSHGHLEVLDAVERGDLTVDKAVEALRRPD
ncbi:DUF2089 domain-containing protein [Sulfobacillus sp. DSM 109850]|uniref:DUF2089 domain-containing protein n=2 Tax=Sulfobacillus harzensis TaxID=2729629 RepID=A0A7Y0L8N1_9FIRM|nr:DUF2089 domain-containing protein [Sulfobacillus harzensis]